MTCLDFWIEEDRVLAAVDTACDDNGTTYHASKLMVLPHARIVFALAGSTLTFTRVVTVAMGYDTIVGFDSAAEQLPGILACHVREAPAFAAAVGAANARDAAPLLALMEKQSIILAGWSDREQRMLALSCNMPSLAEGFTCTMIEGGPLATPWDTDLLGPLPECDTEGAMQAMMQRQIYHIAKHRPQLLPGFGGYMVTAELTRDAITLRKRPLVGVG